MNKDCNGCFGAANNDCRICEKEGKTMKNKEGYTDTTPTQAIRNIEQEEKMRRIENYRRVYRGQRYIIKIDRTRDEEENPRKKVKTMQVVGVYPHIVTLMDNFGIRSSYRWHDFFKSIVRLEE